MSENLSRGKLDKSDGEITQEELDKILEKREKLKNLQDRLVEDGLRVTGSRGIKVKIVGEKELVVCDDEVVYVHAREDGTYDPRPLIEFGRERNPKLYEELKKMRREYFEYFGLGEEEEEREAY